MSMPNSLSARVQPALLPTTTGSESTSTQALIECLSLESHPEGGYFAETDRDFRRVPNPFVLFDPNEPHVDRLKTAHDGSTRSASTTIYYFLTPKTPIGHFHRNKGRTVHTLHQGRGRYVLIHADEVEAAGQKARVEILDIGHDVKKGEKLQWIVEGGKFKSSFLLPDEDGGKGSQGLLISETVVPGFEFEDHDFMTREKLAALVTPEQEELLQWLIRSE